jgi:hypothetical protein
MRSRCGLGDVAAVEVVEGRSFVNRCFDPDFMPLLDELLVSFVEEVVAVAVVVDDCDDWTTFRSFSIMV